MSASLRETNGFHKPLKAGYFWGKTDTFGVGGRLTLAIRSERTLAKGMLTLQAKYVTLLVAMSSWEGKLYNM